MFKHTLICLFLLPSFLSNFLEVTGANWQLHQDVFDRIKAACEDEDFLNPNYSSGLKGSVSLEEKSHAVERESPSEYRYPAPQIYAGWQPPSPPTDGLNSDLFPQGADPKALLFDENLERLSDSRVSPAERLADFRKIEVLWGQTPPAPHKTDIRWRTFWLFRNLWTISQGKIEVSSDLKGIILNYLARDRSKPLVARSITGLWYALRSRSYFEKEVAGQLLTQILKEDVVTTGIHRYWTPVHSPHSAMGAYVREVLDHLKDYSISSWDRINSYDDLASRTERGRFGYGLGTNPYNYEMAVYYHYIRNGEERKAVVHSDYAQRISRFKWRDSSLRELVQKFHALDKSQASAIIELRKGLEKASKDTSLDHNQMIHLNLFQKIFFREHFPDEERDVREAMYKKLKHPDSFNGLDEYSKAAHRFLRRKYYNTKECVKLLISTNKMYGASSSRSENILDIIRHVAKYDLKERANLRLKLRDAVIIPTDP